MIDRNKFDTIKMKLKDYKFNSLEYTEYESVSDFNIVKEDKEGLILLGKEKETNRYEVHWTVNQVEVLSEQVKKLGSNILVSFIPLEWKDYLISQGFKEYGFLRDYWIDQINKVNTDGIQIHYLGDNREKQASEVTYSCQWQSREFRGESEEWVKQWLDGTCPDASICSNTNILVREEAGTLAGIVCVGIYGETSEKGKVIWVREVAVSPSFQGKGFGQNLILQAIAYGKEQGAVRSFLMADELNEPAKHVYEKIGYVGSETEGQLDMVYQVCSE
ncbi:MAG TPA: hypothetical protein DHW61_03215 [Lachnoclostridium phytofermentans]|uniref:N-acetyltransferase domain-containing protein n=1 Tax=Lachnoclostridium phytofermentans TaxID=66219 RepID=A0A3D2X4E1_9FIRM|nr:GNAT family N-acetyltransferase [Lachnoclostridium sp.]HCL01415.1 hypothetical protein [Lachnoclostridium phytofermentans]